ncbi:MAG: DegT/DnrJ/EryC1/StrS family aminotransferase [Dehalococcoidia bacterium]
MDECLQSGRLTLGSNGAALEGAFADVCQVRYAIVVNSGTSALEIILWPIGQVPISPVPVVHGLAN